MQLIETETIALSLTKAAEKATEIATAIRENDLNGRELKADVLDLKETIDAVYRDIRNSLGG